MRRVSIAGSPISGGGRWKRDSTELTDKALAREPELEQPLFAFLLGDAIHADEAGGESIR